MGHISCPQRRRTWTGGDQTVNSARAKNLGQTSLEARRPDSIDDTWSAAGRQQGRQSVEEACEQGRV